MNIKQNRENFQNYKSIKGEKMKNCPYCNEQLNDNANFCHNCGEKYKEKQAELVMVDNSHKKPTQKEMF